MYKDPLPCITILYNRFFTNKLENHVLDLLQLQFIDNYRSLDTYTMVWTGIFSYVSSSFFPFFFSLGKVYILVSTGKKKSTWEKKERKKERKGWKGTRIPYVHYFTHLTVNKLQSLDEDWTIHISTSTDWIQNKSS